MRGYRNGGALPPPLAGEGWGGGRPKQWSCGKTSPTRIASSMRCDLPRKRERLDRAKRYV